MGKHPAEVVAIALINSSAREVTAKIVYYGPGLCGKTTNLEQVHVKTDPATRGRLLSLATQTDRTLFFDLLPIELREIKGVKLRLQLYTVPGQVFYNETRKLVLKNADAVVMVLDSQSAMREKNIESMNNLFENMRELGISVDATPVVLQYNKRDLRGIMSVEEMDRIYNTRRWPRTEAAAIKGEGVIQTLKLITKMVYEQIRKNYFKESGTGGELSFRDEVAAPRPAPRPTPGVVEPARAEIEKPLPAAAAELSPLESASDIVLPDAEIVEQESPGPAAASAVAFDFDRMGALLDEKLRTLGEELDRRMLASLQTPFTTLNVSVGKLSDEAGRLREEVSSLRRLVEAAVEEARKSEAVEKKPRLGGLFRK